MQDRKNTGPDNAGPNTQGWKMQDRKIRNWKCRTRKCRTRECRTLNTNNEFHIYARDTSQRKPQRRHLRPQCTGSTWRRRIGAVRPRPFLFCVYRLIRLQEWKRVSLVPHANRHGFASILMRVKRVHCFSWIIVDTVCLAVLKNIWNTHASCTSWD